MSEFRHIGKVRRRQDGRAIVTGKALYCDDLPIKNCKYAKVLHSPYPHAEIVSIDTSEAEKLPGVIGVMTYKNAPAWKTGVPAHRPVMSQHLRFVGDPVAAVAAAIYPLPFTKKIKGYAVFLPPLFCSINSITRSNSSSNWNLMVISLFSYT